MPITTSIKSFVCVIGPQPPPTLTLAFSGEMGWRTMADDKPRIRLSRRRFLGSAGTAGSAMVLGAAPASGRSLSAQETSVILRVARTGAVFPIPLPSFDESGTALSRATPGRLRVVARRLKASRLASVQAASAELTALGHPDHRTQDQLLADIGGIARSGHGRAELTALVALAIATVDRRFSPGDDDAAELWIGGLRLMAERGVTPSMGS